MKNVLSITILLIFFFSSSAQNHDYFWMMGYGSNPNDSSYGGSIIGFNVSPPSIEYKYLDINFDNVLHVIEKPDLKGLACEVNQHGVQLPTYNAFSLPHFPNYRLEALEGSPCDTLEEMNTSIYEKRGNQEQKISIYPNPANSAIYLKKEANTDAHVKQVSLFNALGHRVKFWKWVEEGQALAVADLNAGIYFYIIQSEEGILGKGKLVIGKER